MNCEPIELMNESIISSTDGEASPPAEGVPLEGTPLPLPSTGSVFPGFPGGGVSWVPELGGGEE